MSELTATDKVRALEVIGLQGPQIDVQTVMFAHGGLGVRTIFVRKGQTITGALARLPNVCVMCGDIEVTTDQGVKRFTGYHILKASAGFKRAGYAHADTWWSTFWRTDETEAHAMEDEMTVEAAMLQTRRDGIEFADPKLLEN